MPDWLGNPALIIAFILSVFNLWDRIDMRLKSAKEPTKQLEHRISTLEKLVNTDYAHRFSSYDEYFARDLKRIEDIEVGNKVTQKALLALLAHAIDGNEVEGLKQAKDDLTQFLIDK